MTIMGSPRSTDLFQGLDLTLTCRIEVDSAVDTPITVMGLLSLDNDSLVDGSGDGIVNDGDVISEINSTHYEISILFQPLSITDDGIYICSVIVTPQNSDFVNGATASRSQNIEVEGKYIICSTLLSTQVIFNFLGVPPPLVNITDEGEPIAGHSDYALICIIERDPELSSLSILALEWLDPSGNVITSGINFTVSGSGPTNDTVIKSRLSFSNLYTSQAGVYVCRGLLTIPGTDTNHSIEAIFAVHVKC